jgi:O-antigen ligase
LISAALFIIEKDPKWRIFDGICYLANTYTLMRADTLGCFIAVFVGLVFLFIMLRIVYGHFNRTVLLLTGVFIGLFLLSSLVDDSLMKSFLGLFGETAKIINNDPDAGSTGTGRWRLWTHTVQYIGERPFFGWGSEGIFDRLEEEAGNSRPHNEYLQYAAFFGIPAALCYISGVVSVFIKGLKKRAELDIYTVAAFAASFGYLISAFFGVTMGFTAPYFFIVLGFAVRPCLSNKEKIKN